LTFDGADIVRKIHQISGAFPIVDERFRAAGGFLRKSRQIADAMDMDALLLWITPKVVIDLPHNTRDALRSHLSKQLVRRGAIEESQKDLVLRLPIFRSWVVTQAASGAKLGYIVLFSLTSRTSYISLSPTTRYFIVPAIPVLPVIKGTCFLKAENSDEQLLSELGYSHPVSIQKFLESFVLPNINSQPTWLLDSLIELVFRCAAVNNECFKQLATVSFVRVCGKDGVTGERLRPSSVIKNNARIAMLYFSDEAVFGDGIYSSKGSYNNHLELLGMKSHFDSIIADDRIQEYAASTDLDEGLFEKSTLLLEFLNDNDSSVDIKPQWVPLMKLPAIKRGKCVLPVTECRPEAFRSLVEGVLGIVPGHVKPSLQKAFGWDKILEPEVLGSRINEITSTSATIESNLYSILKYIDSIWEKLGDQVDTYISKVASAISDDALFPSSSGNLSSRDRLFLEGAHPFEPYLSNIPPSFRNFESVLAQLGIDRSPSSQCLVKVITELPRHVLTEKEMNVVINILQHLCNVDEFDSSELFLPDIDGQLVHIDLFTQVPGRHAHPRIPRAFAFQYSIPQRGDDPAFFQDVHNDDVFGDYCQEEQISTRIFNTLKGIFPLDILQ
jgi:hypothetical protein